MASQTLTRSLGRPRSSPASLQTLFSQPPTRSVDIRRRLLGQSAARPLAPESSLTTPKRCPSPLFKSCDVESSWQTSFRRSGSTGNTQRAYHHGRRGDEHVKRSQISENSLALFAAACAAAGVFYNLPFTQAESVEALAVHEPIHESDIVGAVDLGNGVASTPKIRLAELPRHDRNSPSKWVVKGHKVYDITDFVEAHPGGEVILRACGGDVDAYWKFFTIHNKQEVRDILEQYYIGHIDERDLDPNGAVDWNRLGKQAVTDPFKDDPARDECLIQHTAKPCNAETPANLLTDFLTPIRLWFVRNHLWVPEIAADSHELSIELSDGEVKTYTLADLKANFPVHTITATMQCAGNRRSHMSKSPRGQTSGLQWDTGAIGTAEWTGVRLRDVLRDAGYCADQALQRKCTEPDFQDRHIHFAAPGDTYAASVPICTALNPTSDVLLAWDMNGEPLNRDHGGPLRAIVPGITAARSVKWLGRISIASEEAGSQWQRKDYKIFPPQIKASEVKVEDWDERSAIQETPVQSAITAVRSDNQNRSTSAQGWAFSGGGRAIVRVDVSADGGKTWKEARMHKDNAKGSRRWAWTRWSADWSADELSPEREFVVRAVDDANNCQPGSFDDIWNFRGLCATAWHRVKIV